MLSLFAKLVNNRTSSNFSVLFEIMFLHRFASGTNSPGLKSSTAVPLLAERGPNKPTIPIHSLARMLRGQGRFAEGEALPQHVLTGRERVPATKHLDSLPSQNDFPGAQGEHGKG